jgi:hypothetical protein
MFSLELKRLVRRLLVLAMLVGCLTVLSQTQTARATTCCSTCDANLQNCFNHCHNASCQEMCLYWWDICNETCVDC